MPLPHLPARWRKTSPRWHPLTELRYRTIVDQQLVNKYIVATLPDVGVTVEATIDDSTWLYWRELDVNGDIVAAGGFPPWMVFDLTV